VTEALHGQRRSDMAKVINCEDGVVVRGDTDEELLANARRHIEEAHPEMAGQVTDEQLLGMAVTA
jgi:predicted small metal-binding protein